MAKNIPNIHSGEVLAEEFLLPLNLSPNVLARALRVPLRRINEIVLSNRLVTPNTALRLTRYSRNTPGFWMALQVGYELEESQDTGGGNLNGKFSPRRRTDPRLPTCLYGYNPARHEIQI